MRREKITVLSVFGVYKKLRKDCGTKALFINKKPCDGMTDMKPDIMDDLKSRSMKVLTTISGSSSCLRFS